MQTTFSSNFVRCIGCAETTNDYLLYNESLVYEMASDLFIGQISNLK